MRVDMYAVAENPGLQGAFRSWDSRACPEMPAHLHQSTVMKAY